MGVSYTFFFTYSPLVGLTLSLSSAYQFYFYGIMG